MNADETALGLVTALCSGRVTGLFSEGLNASPWQDTIQVDVATSDATATTGGVRRMTRRNTASIAMTPPGSSPYPDAKRADSVAPPIRSV